MEEGIKEYLVTADRREWNAGEEDIAEEERASIGESGFWRDRTPVGSGGFERRGEGFHRNRRDHCILTRGRRLIAGGSEFRPAGIVLVWIGMRSGFGRGGFPADSLPFPRNYIFCYICALGNK